ncbi:MAG: hypothetical protein OSA02_00140 [Schleiferiaceae bacterium]|jgi:hypothetical protein|nr:hypothetical protein [Schleiferiaceae bacterium]
MSSEGNKGRFGILIGAMAVAVIALGVMLYLRSEENHKLDLEKQSLAMELTIMKEDLLSQVGENDSLNAFIQYETSRLSTVIDSINSVNVQNKKQLTNYRYRLSGMKKENASLVSRLDSTNTAYAILKLREQMVADSLNNAIAANQNLTGRNTSLTTTVAQGKQLVLASSKLTPVRITGSGKERSTKKAKRTDRINVCVTLAKNRIADQGERVLYVKLFAPNGKPVDAPESNKAVVGGEQSGFNGSAKITYTGDAQEICIAANRATDAPIKLTSGIYTAAIMTNSYVVGTVAIELR